MIGDFSKITGHNENGRKMMWNVEISMLLKFDVLGWKKGTIKSEMLPCTSYREWRLAKKKIQYSKVQCWGQNQLRRNQCRKVPDKPFLSRKEKNAGKLKLGKKYYATSSRKRLFNLSSKRFSSDETTKPASSNPTSGMLNWPHPTRTMAIWINLVQLSSGWVGPTSSNSPSGELDRPCLTRHQASWISFIRLAIRQPGSIPHHALSFHSLELAP